MEFPTIDKFAKDVAEKALDEFIYEGKTIREWVDIIAKQQPCEDCISRAEAIKEFQIYREYSSNRSNADWVDRIEAVLKDLPSVTPKGETITDFADRCCECGAKHGKLLKSKTGSWIVHPKGGCAHLVCSKCLSDAPFDCKTNFCPNCGSRMIEPQESECDD